MTMTTIAQGAHGSPGSPSGPDHAIVAEGLAKTLGTTRALDGIDLVVPRGTVLGRTAPARRPRCACCRP